MSTTLPKGVKEKSTESTKNVSFKYLSSHVEKQKFHNYEEGYKTNKT